MAEPMRPKFSVATYMTDRVALLLVEVEQFCTAKISKFTIFEKAPFLKEIHENLRTIKNGDFQNSRIKSVNRKWV